MTTPDINFRIEIKPGRVVRLGRRDDGHFMEGFQHEGVPLDGFHWQVTVTGDLSCAMEGGAETFDGAARSASDAIAAAKTLAREVEKP